MKALSLGCVVLVSVLIIGHSVQAAPRSGSTTWGPWSFTWNVGNKKEGLEITNVHFNDVKVIHKASLPVIRVKYIKDGGIFSSGCGPYADRMKWGNMVQTSCQNEKICQRQWGNDLLELGAFSVIGGYDLYHAWYFTKSGRLESRLWSKGWSCELTHRHHAYWRIDFDIRTTSNEIYRFQKSSPSVSFPDDWTEYERETNEAQTPGTADIGWWIADSASRDYVIVRPLSTEAFDNFSNKDVAVRRYHGDEDEGWAFGAWGHLGYLNNEYLWTADNVFWWVGHLSHTWIDGVDEEGVEWHSVGPKVYVGWD